jgi:hypothetical protein
MRGKRPCSNFFLICQKEEEGMAKEKIFDRRV